MMNSCNSKKEERHTLYAPQLIELGQSVIAEGESGMDEGVSGAFAGMIGDWLIWGGGCNFPSDDPSTKRFYRSLFAVREKSDGTHEWKSLTPLQVPCGYGASLLSSDGKSLFLLGGTDGKNARKEIYRVSLVNDTPNVELLEEALPFGWYEGGAALVGNDLYLAGGWKSSDNGNAPLLHLTKFSLESGKTEQLHELSEGARIQPVLFFQNDALYLYGGFRPGAGLNPPYMHEKAYKLALGGDAVQWEEIAHQPTVSLEKGVRKLLFVGSAVTRNPITDDIFLVGGVDWDVFEKAVLREHHEGIARSAENPDPQELEAYDQARKDYLSMQPEEYRFMAHLLKHNPNGIWEVVASDSAFATAGAAVSASDEAVYVVGGERKPRVRTPHIWKVKIGE